MKRSALVLLLGLFVTGPASAQPVPDMPVILGAREQARVVDHWLARRLDTVVPMLMRREGIGLWIVSSREYNEDPAMHSMLPATWLAARRRTILVFHDRGGDQGVERLAVARYAIGSLFEAAWNPDDQPDQWARLAEIVAERDPERIAVNRSTDFAHADGMTHTEFEAFEAALPDRLRGRIVSGERLAVGWLETRIPEEMDVYPRIVRIARTIIREGLSARAIQPGVTTTADVEWWYRDRIRELGLGTWFHPSVDVQRAESGGRGDDFSSRPGEQVILPGDLLHVDFGITYLRLNTDTQQHAYVLRPGETEAPEGLKRALATGNRLQDFLVAEFAEGRTGNEILAGALAAAKAAGIRPSIYTHPVGLHGHAAGPTIGLWDRQDGVPGPGDYPVFANTAWSIELNALVSVPEWGGQDVRIMLEEDAFFDGRSMRWIDPRQEALYLVPGG
jgi:Xaa-Pro aminopeptidase